MTLLEWSGYLEILEMLKLDLLSTYSAYERIHFRVKEWGCAADDNTTKCAIENLLRLYLRAELYNNKPILIFLAPAQQ